MFGTLNKYFNFFNHYENLVLYAKDKIKNFFMNKPEKNLVESNIFLLGEHILFSVLGLVLFYKETWFYDITLMWEESMNFSIIFYYFFYTTRYMIQTKMMTGEEKDYNSMMTHHISTILLLTLSFFHYHRIGVIIAFSHDIGDLFFLPAKLFHKFYETRNIKIFNLLSYTFYICFVIIFYLTRIVLNLEIIRHITDTVFYEGEEIILYNPKIYTEGYILFLLLLINLSIQCFWQWMIIKFTYNIFAEENCKDEKGNEYFKKDKDS